MSGDLKVWEERRSRVGTIIEEYIPELKNVLDLGCGDGKLFQLLKFNRQFEHFYGIDLDYRECENAESRVGPEMDHLFHPVSNSPPLTVAMFQGDITRPSKKLKREWDAITLVEVIEHLHPEELKALPVVLFHHYKAKVIIITTPNQEYNEVIRGFKRTSYGGFRHPDHKFEWSRREFKDWSHTQCRRYGFTVRFETVGRINPVDEEDFFDVEKYGRCTQIAIFEPLNSPDLQENRNPRQSSEVKKAPEIKHGTLREVVRVTFPTKKKKGRYRRSYLPKSDREKQLRKRKLYSDDHL